MSDTVKIEISSNAAAILAQIGAFSSRMGQAIVQTLDDQNEITKGHIEETRLTGQGPFPVSEGRLGVVNNQFRTTLRASKAVVSGVETVSSIGTPVKHAGPNEFGFRGVVQVRSHRRKTAANNVYAARKDGRGVTKKVIASGVSIVRAHSMQMNVPERAPIRRGIADRAPDYTKALSAAIITAWGGAS